MTNKSKFFVQNQQLILNMSYRNTQNSLLKKHHDHRYISSHLLSYFDVTFCLNRASNRKTVLAKRVSERLMYTLGFMVGQQKIIQNIPRRSRKKSHYFDH